MVTQVVLPYMYCTLPQKFGFGAENVRQRGAPVAPFRHILFCLRGWVAQLKLGVQRMTEAQGRWAKVTQIESVDPAAVHGQIFVLGKDGLCAYEYQDGAMPDLSAVGEGFLEDFANYLTMNDLKDLVGLQVLGGCGDQSMSELILDEGTVMLHSSVVKGCTPSRITGWRFEVDHGNPRVCQANETHSKMISGNHKVFNAGKPHPRLESVDDLKVALADAGIL